MTKFASLSHVSVPTTRSALFSKKRQATNLTSHLPASNRFTNPTLDLQQPKSSYQPTSTKPPSTHLLERTDLQNLHSHKPLSCLVPGATPLHCNLAFQQ